jgi:hypothetical protein
MVASTISLEFSVDSIGFSPTASIKITGSELRNMCTSGDQAKAHGGVLYALTDIGFLAIAHRQEEWIKIVDLRKSKLLFNDVIRNESKSKGKTKENPICCIHWTIARAETGKQFSFMDIFKLHQTSLIISPPQIRPLFLDL